MQGTFNYYDYLTEYIQQVFTREEFKFKPGIQFEKKEVETFVYIIKYDGTLIPARCIKKECYVFEPGLLQIYYLYILKLKDKKIQQSNLNNPSNNNPLEFKNIEKSK